MDKVVTVLVDGVVCEMHADVILAEKTEEGSSAMLEDEWIQSTTVYLNVGIFIESKMNVSDHVAVCWLVVLGGAEADQALLEHEYPEWVTGRHQHVEPQIELVSVNNERLRRKWPRRSRGVGVCPYGLCG